MKINNILIHQLCINFLLKAILFYYCYPIIYFFFIACIRDQFTMVEFGEKTKELIAYCENEYMFRFGDTATSSLGFSENKS